MSDYETPEYRIFCEATRELSFRIRENCPSAYTITDRLSDSAGCGVTVLLSGAGVVSEH